MSVPVLMYMQSDSAAASIVALIDILVIVVANVFGRLESTMR